MPSRWLFMGVAAAFWAAMGCQGSTPAGKPADEEATVSRDKNGEKSGGRGEETARPPIPVLEGVDSFEGNWVLAPSIQMAARCLWLFRLSPGPEGKWKIEDLANEPMFGKISGVEAKVEGNQIRLDGEVNNPNAAVKTAKLSFLGTLQDGVVWGNLVLGDTPAPFATRLLPTDAESLSDYSNAMAEEGNSDFEKALREPDPSHGLWRVAKKVPSSPLAMEVYNRLFAEIAKWNFTEDEVRAAAEDFRNAAQRWGPRLQANAEIDAGLNLARARKFVDLAEQFLNDGESRWPERTELMTAKLKGGRANIRIARGLVAIAGKDADAATAAYADLQAVLAEQPYLAEVIIALAEHAAKTGQTEKALEYYLALVGLPMMERMALASRLGMPADEQMPRAALERLWTDKHGSLDGLDRALEETYEREIGSMLQKIRETAGPLPPPDAGNRVTLVELFTGAMCDPCVAADLALSAVLQDVPATEVVQLTYHSHIPGPDPLTCADGEGRAKYYNVEGTPTVFMNGQQVPQIGGFFLPAHIEQNFHVLRSPIEFFLKQSTDVTIEPKAEAADGQLKVHVAVRGVPDDVIGKVRLRVAVVEDDVHYVAPNGIRHHRMVVRTLLGGPGGKAANKDKGLEYSITIPLVELKARQIGYLLQMEHGKRVAFPDKPVVMKPLHLAAFVQNDATKEVLQAAMTPVAGELVYPRIEARANGEIRIVPDDPSREHPVDAPADAAPEK